MLNKLHFSYCHLFDTGIFLSQFIDYFLKIQKKIIDFLIFFHYYPFSYILK